MAQTTVTEGIAGVLLMAMEIGGSRWKIVFGDGRATKRREVNIDAGDRAGLEQGIARSKQKLGLGADAKVVSCYEAGRDGFWIHRLLGVLGVENVVVDSSSILVNRRQRRAKTDRLDARKLYEMLVRYRRGEADVWRVVQVPSPAEEDSRRLHRERERLVVERGAHQTRIKALMCLCGVRIGDARKVEFGAVRQWDGTSLPADLKAELEREQERLLTADKQLRELERDRQTRTQEAKRAMTEQAGTRASEVGGAKKAVALMALYGIGDTSSWTLAHELFWRHFDSRREVASATGLTPTPYDSGDGEREQGISKAGSPRLRKLLIEMAWAWLRFQPTSRLSCWFQRRFGGGGSRMRRIGIVALARRLVVDLWRYLEQGVVPEGARLREV